MVFLRLAAQCSRLLLPRAISDRAVNTFRRVQMEKRHEGVKAALIDSSADLLVGRGAHKSCNLPGCKFECTANMERQLNVIIEPSRGQLLRTLLAHSPIPWQWIHWISLLAIKLFCAHFAYRAFENFFFVSHCTKNFLNAGARSFISKELKRSLNGNNLHF